MGTGSDKVETLANDLHRRAKEGEGKIQEQELKDAQDVLDGKSKEVEAATPEQRMQVFRMKEKELDHILKGYAANYEVYKTLGDEAAIREIRLGTAKTLQMLRVVRAEMTRRMNGMKIAKGDKTVLPEMDHGQ